MSNTFTYKGYTGTVALSVEDRCLYGKIVGISDLVSYEGNTLEGVRAEFESSVDDYIELCAELGKEPQKAI